MKSNDLRKFIWLILLLNSFACFSFAHISMAPSGESMAYPVASSDVFTDIIDDLIDHVQGDIVLSDMDFENNHDLLIGHMSVLATDKAAVLKAFELLDLFEGSLGALFTTPNTRTGFNRAYAADGLNLHRNIILIHQGLIDHTYTAAWLQDSAHILEGKYFNTVQYFPGFVDVPEDSTVMEHAKVKCSYMLAGGSQPWANIGNPNVVRPTGCYLAPGSIAEIMVPESLVGKGIQIRVGAHFWDLESKSRYKRFDRVSIVYAVNDTVTRIANPLGGGIYLEIPIGVDEGVLDIELKNVVKSPFFSKKSFHETSLTEWLDVERKRAAPWTDFETDKFMMQVPTSWIYEFDDPLTLLEEWDKSMDAVSDLLGRPRVADRHKNYLQFDVIIRGSAYHPGYPMSNTPYDPNAATDGLPKHKILEGPQYDQDIHFHELGHEVAITKFVGETEAIVNFLYVPVLNRCFGYSLDEAFQKSLGPSYNYFSTKDNTTRTRLVSDTFDEGLPRNTCSCNKNEVRYQHRGYAHYVDIVELFGYEALERFWKSESDAADMGNPFPVNDQEQDDRIFRMSLAAGVDLRPLFHFWGIHPMDQEALVELMEENNLALPLSIKEKLHQYQKLIPSNYNEFVDFGNELYPDFLNYSGSQFDFGAGWYQATAATYDETKADAIKQALSDIIIYYYGSDCFELEEFLTPEFSFQTQYCYNSDVSSLPMISDNGIEGLWFPEEINPTEFGMIEYSFVPGLEACAVEQSVLVQINEPINISIEVVQPLCYGDYGTALFIPDNGAGEDYTYSIDGDSLAAGTYQVVVSDDLGCLDTFDFEVAQPDQIVIDLIGNEVVVSGGVAPYTISIDTIGNVQFVTVVDNNGCESLAEFMITSIDENAQERVRVFPNPASDELYLDLTGVSYKVEAFQLVSIDGQMIQLSSKRENTLDLYQVKNGVYVLQILFANGSRVHKKVSVIR